MTNAAATTTPRECAGCYEETNRLMNFLGGDGRARALCYECFNKEEQRMNLRFENLNPAWRRMRRG